MIRQRSRIMSLVAVALGVAAVAAQSATAMPFGGDGRGLAFPAHHLAYHPATTVVRPNPDQQVPAAHATPTTAAPATASTEKPASSTGSSFDWAALLIGLGAGGLIGLVIGGYGSGGGRPRPLRRERVPETS